MDDLFGPSVKLETAQRNLKNMKAWYDAKKPVTAEDKRTFEAYEYAGAFTETRAHGKLPAGASVTPAQQEAAERAEAAEPELELGGEPEKEAVKTFEWKLALCPWEIPFAGMKIEKGTKLGDMEKKVVKAIKKQVLTNAAKFPVKTASEKQFAAAVEMAVAELGIEL